MCSAIQTQISSDTLHVYFRFCTCSQFFCQRYNSYNRDDGYDLYEGEFIDDSNAIISRTPRRKRKKRTTRSVSSSSSSSDVGGQRSKRKPAAVQLSSGEELSPSERSYGNESTKTTLLANNLRAAVNRGSGTSSEEDVKKVRKKRRIQCPESDEELRYREYVADFFCNFSAVTLKMGGILSTFKSGC